jgi:hypothetical protein
MASTILLDTVDWDLVLDISGNIAVAAQPYSLAQDAASAIKLFQGELYYNISIGVPYWSLILGESPSISLMKAKWVSAALSVLDVTSAVCFITSITDRIVGGQVQVTNAAGQTAAAAFGGSVPPSPSSGNPSLNFSNPSNSQYLPGGL